MNLIRARLTSIGKSPPFYGKHHTKESKRKISEAIKKWYQNNPHPKGMLGKKHSTEAKRKTSEAKRGKNNPMYGKYHTEEAKLKMKGLNLKHGDAIRGKRVALYKVFAGIKQRCLNPNCKAYKYYGGKGITICDEWLKSYQAFKFWALLSGYKEGLTIDRINHKGNYEPANCQWITQSDNARKVNKERDVAGRFVSGEERKK